MNNSDFVYLVLKRHYRRTGKILTALQLRKCFKTYSTDALIEGAYKFDEWLDSTQKVAK